jgi:hypothetical protein
MEQRLERIQKKVKALTDGMERMVKRMEEFMVACDIKLQPSHAEDPSCPEVIRIEEQPTKETLPSPLANPPGQQLTKNHSHTKNQPPSTPTA